MAYRHSSEDSKKTLAGSLLAFVAATALIVSTFYSGDLLYMVAGVFVALIGASELGAWLLPGGLGRWPLRIAGVVGKVGVVVSCVVFIVRSAV